MWISVKTVTQETIEMGVRSSDTIRDIKDKIQEREGIPSDQQDLIFNQMVLDDGSGIFVDFHIINQSTLTLMRKSRGFMQIFIKNRKDEETFSLEVKRSDTIGHVKAKIHEKELIPPDQQVLIFEEKALWDSSTLVDFYINNRSILTLVEASGWMQIFVNSKSLARKIITLGVKPSYTIGNVNNTSYIPWSR